MTFYFLWTNDERFSQLTLKISQISQLSKIDMLLRNLVCLTLVLLYKMNEIGTHLNIYKTSRNSFKTIFAL